MDQAFPFGFPRPTAGYMTLYVLTLVVHFVFVGYVMAGTGYLAVASLFKGLGMEANGRSPVTEILRDWMPLALSAAITAGVAPLLFLQILYKKEFYTANLLLFHRWMAILPCLIVGFYLLYLLKTDRVNKWPAVLRGLVGLGALICFVYTGFTWTQNHLVSVDAASWPRLYAEGFWFHDVAQLVARSVFWACMSVPTMCTAVAWQLSWHAPNRTGGVELSLRRLAGLAIVGISAMLAAAAWNYSTLRIESEPDWIHQLVRPYLLIAGIGLTMQIVGWVGVMRTTISMGWLTLASVGTLAFITGIVVVREAIRLARVDMTQLYDAHAGAARVGGFPLFALFLLVNFGLVIWCIWIGSTTRRVSS